MFPPHADGSIRQRCKRFDRFFIVIMWAGGYVDLLDDGASVSIYRSRLARDDEKAVVPVRDVPHFIGKHQLFHSPDDRGYPQRKDRIAAFKRKISLKR